VPKGCFGGIFARSGLALKKGLRPANAVGVVDSDYRDSVKVALYNDSNKIQKVIRGDRIAQLIIIPYKEIELEVVDEVSETERGQGGFGSTGK
jgi:dUTP pyrophosphatase